MLRTLQDLLKVYSNQLDRLKEELRCLRIQLLNINPIEYGYLAGAIDDVLAEDHQEPVMPLERSYAHDALSL